MEEEYGYFDQSIVILLNGLQHCPHNEALITKTIKQLERKHRISHIRNILGSLQNASIEKTWKSILEGALFELRVGRTDAARKALSLLMKRVPWYGPIYFEAFKLEEKEGNYQAAMEIIERGLKSLPRYGPLWFALLKLREREDVEKEWKGLLIEGGFPRLSHLRGSVAEAIKSISRELVWKIHFEHAQAEERVADLSAEGCYLLWGSANASCLLRKSTDSTLNNLLGQNNRNVTYTLSCSTPLCSFTAATTFPWSSINSSSRESLLRSRGRHLRLGSARETLAASLLHCPANLRWKIWLAGSRLELSARRLAEARALLCRAFADVPVKSKSLVYLEASRLEEYVGNIPAAINLLRLSIRESSEWKLLLEGVLLEARTGDIYMAIRLATHAVEKHPGTGRLWAVLIQLCHRVEGVIRADKLAKFPWIKWEDSVELEEKDQTSYRKKKRIGKIYCHDPSQELLHLSSDDRRENRNCFGKMRTKIPRKAVVLMEAIQHVPKSGEVWTEAARCSLNPMNASVFDLGKSQQYLYFAIQFTPQYGDTFIEYLRLEMICQVFLPLILKRLGLPLTSFLTTFLSQDPEADTIEMKWNRKLIREKYVDPCPVGQSSDGPARKPRKDFLRKLETLKASWYNSRHLMEMLKQTQIYSLTRRLVVC